MVTIRNRHDGSVIREFNTDRSQSMCLYAADLRGAVLSEMSVESISLDHADLRGADINGCDLGESDMSGADLRGAILPEGVPVVPNIDAAILAAIESGGILRMDDWHTCGTTHCRAGWAIHLAGEAGYALEDRFGPCAAGAFIYAASRANRPVPIFDASDEEALADIRDCAAEADKQETTMYGLDEPVIDHELPRRRIVLLELSMPYEELDDERPWLGKVLVAVVLVMVVILFAVAWFVRS